MRRKHRKTKNSSLIPIGRHTAFTKRGYFNPRKGARTHLSGVDGLSYMGRLQEALVHTAGGT